MGLGAFGMANSERTMATAEKVRFGSAFARAVAPASVGYGAFLSYYPIGPLGTAFLTQHATDSTAILLARAIAVLTCVLVLIIWKAGKTDDLLHNRKILNLSFVGILVSVLLPSLTASLASTDVGVYLFALVFGVSTATPKLAFYEAFLAVFRQHGRIACMLTILACFVVAPLFMVFEQVMFQGPWASAAVMAGTVALSWACLALTERAPFYRPPTPPANPTYRLPLRMKVSMVGFGVTFAVSYSIPSLLGFGSAENPGLSMSVFATGTVGVLCAALAVTRLKGIERAPFGLVLRWALALTGSVLVFVPTIAAASPMVACSLCSGIYVLVGTLMIVFILEICQEQGLTLCTVTTSNYGVFVMGVCGTSALLSLLLTVAGEMGAVRIITATGVAALFLIIPTLPGRISRAQDLVLENLPEEESADERRKRVCTSLIAQGGLSEREAEVLDLLLQGHTREEIAKRLVISTWTVKNHASSVYGKLGVHSARELTALLEKPKG